MIEYESPVYKVIAVPVEKVMANDYNPNIVAPPEMQLLELSIWEDGYTMPCVCYYLPEVDKYELVDVSPLSGVEDFEANLRAGERVVAGVGHPEGYFQPYGIHHPPQPRPRDA